MVPTSPPPPERNVGSCGSDSSPDRRRARAASPSRADSRRRTLQLRVGNREAGVGHAQRLEDRRAEVLVEALARDHLDEPRQHVGRPRIEPVLARMEPQRFGRQQFAQACDRGAGPDSWRRSRRERGDIEVLNGVRIRFRTCASSCRGPSSTRRHEDRAPVFAARSFTSTSCTREIPMYRITELERAAARRATAARLR